MIEKNLFAGNRTHHVQLSNLLPALESCSKIIPEQ